MPEMTAIIFNQFTMKKRPILSKQVWQTNRNQFFPVFSVARRQSQPDRSIDARSLEALMYATSPSRVFYRIAQTFRKIIQQNEFADITYVSWPRLLFRQTSFRPPKAVEFPSIDSPFSITLRLSMRLPGHTNGYARIYRRRQHRL